jgi:predicted pyridoxine 5'-phosphate oxidase superfamily flavin-nucleotide-binding protein
VTVANPGLTSDAVAPPPLAAPDAHSEGTVSADGETCLPGSSGEHLLQEKYGTTSRSSAFYRKQVLERLNPPMCRFIAQQEMVFIATADSRGEADCSFRAGLKGFVRVLDDKTLAYPEYRGNGVFASLGNLSENPHVGMLFIDFYRHTIGLHVNGKAHMVENEELLMRADLSEEMLRDFEVEGGRRPERWVLVEIEEAYVHCSKHIPLLAKRDKEIDWGTDDAGKKGGDYFQAKGIERPWVKDISNGHPVD